MVFGFFLREVVGRGEVGGLRNGLSAVGPSGIAVSSGVGLNEKGPAEGEAVSTASGEFVYEDLPPAVVARPLGMVIGRGDVDIVAKG